MTIYLDNAASSCPKPSGVAEAVRECLDRYCANPGRGAHRRAVEAARIIYRTRQKAAAFLRVNDSANIIFTQNATDALNTAMYGFLKPGDHVVTSTVEHNAVARPLAALSRRGVEVTWVETDATGLIDPGEIGAALKSNTRLAVLTHASNITGAIQPVAEIGKILKEGGVTFLVDAAQSGGTVPLDLSSLPVDMMALTGHKGLLGPQGIGLLHISPSVELESVRQGGTGTRSEDEQDALPRPDRYECGTQNTPGIAGLGAGIDYITSAGLENIASLKAELTKCLHVGLNEIEGVETYGPPPSADRAPLVAFNVTGLSSAETSAILDRNYDIASRSGLHCAPGAHKAMGTLKTGAVRLSVGPFNTTEQIEEALAAVAETAAGAGA